jgi:UDP:flavonoid glycosyltransferase YjiC (YdhE family)
LDSARYEVHLVCDPRYLSLFDELGFPVHTIRSIESDVFHDRLANGNPLYTTMELRLYVQEDLRVMTEWEPDLVVGDFRLSLSVSARLSGVPYATVTNAYWSPYARPRFLVPELPITERFGPRLAQGLFSLMRPFVFAHHASALNRVRRDYGLPSVGHDLAYVFSEADYTLYADLPQVVPMVNPAPHHHYIGPVVWSFGRRPYWWPSLRNNVRTAYVTPDRR